MAKKRADNIKPENYSSLTTPDFKHRNYQAFGAEILSVRRAMGEGIILPEYFWRESADCPRKYKTQYGVDCECVRKLMKTYPPHFVIQVLFYSKMEKTDYAFLTFLVQKRWKSWNENIAQRLQNRINVVRTAKQTIDEIAEQVTPDEIENLMPIRPTRVKY